MKLFCLPILMMIMDISFRFNLREIKNTNSNQPESDILNYITQCLITVS